MDMGCLWIAFKSDFLDLIIGVLSSIPSQIQIYIGYTHGGEINGFGNKSKSHQTRSSKNRINMLG